MVEEQAPATEQVAPQTAEQTTSDVSRGTSIDTPTDISVQPRPENVPEKFWNTETGEIRVDDVLKSNAHLEKFVGGKKEEMRDELINELQVSAREGLPEKPDGYTLPKLVEGITEEMVEANPMTNWWRERCHTLGLPQDEFENGVNFYTDTLLKSLPNIEEETAKLGENAKERVEAVNAWVTTVFNPEQVQTIQQTLGSSAQGVEILERIMESQKHSLSQSDTVAQPEQELTIADVKQMMNDKRYFDPRFRDSEYVKQVDGAWARLQLSGKV